MGKGIFCFMKKLLIVLFLALFVMPFLSAQNLLWEQTRFFNPDSVTRQESYSSAIWWDNDKIITLGISSSFSYFLDIYSTSGKYIQTINGVSGNIGAYGGLGLLRNKSGEVIYHGQIFNYSNFSGINLLLQKLTNNGDTLPRQVYGSDNSNIVFKIKEDTTDNSLITSGWGTTSNSAAFMSLGKLNSQLQQVWLKPYPKIGLDTVVYCGNVVFKDNGNYVASGNFEITSKNFHHPYLLEINNKGDTMRSKILIIRNKNIKEDGYKRGLTYTADKGFLFLATIDTFMTNKDIPGQIGAVVKLDSNFKTQWVNYLISGSNTVDPNNIVELADSSYLIMAVENKFFGDYYTKTSLYKISKSGTLISKWYLPSTICKIPLGRFIFSLNDSSIVIFGSCGENKGYIARIGKVGNPMHPDPRPAPYIAPPEPPEPPIYTISSLIIPNLITPNNDGINETFEIGSNQIHATGVQLKIYNRWGSQIYASHN